MRDSETPSTSGPKPGQSADEFDITIREATSLLTDDTETPRSVFLALRYENGTDFVHAHAGAHDGDIDGKVYDLLAPLAVHVQQVADAANADAATVMDCVDEMLASVADTTDTADTVDTAVTGD